jgi:hypothetical protein
MKLIIAGGRDYELTAHDHTLLLRLHITEVVSGCARGADYGGEVFAYDHNIPVRRFPANWNRYGKRAGFLRNKEMAKYADAVALFPGGRGTEDMYKQAKSHGLVIHDFRVRDLWGG